MSARNQQAKRAAKLFADTSSAAVSVASSRLLELADPSEFLSARQQREVARMLTEKMTAGFDGWMSASAAMAALPLRMLQTSTRPSAFTAAGCMEAWMAMGGLWIGVGNAALQPARNTVVENRARLRAGVARRSDAAARIVSGTR